MSPILYLGGKEGVGGFWSQKLRLLKGVKKLEETWADKGRYPLIKSENRGRECVRNLDQRVQKVMS